MLASIMSSASASRPTSVLPGRMVDAPGEVTARDRRRRRLDLPKRCQAGPHQRQAEASEQHDGGGRGQRVGNLQAGDRAIEVAETARDDQMTSAGRRAPPGRARSPRRTRGGGCERRSDVTELRGRQPRSVRGAQRPARHADLPVRSDHLDQELRGQRLRTTAATRAGAAAAPRCGSRPSRSPEAGCLPWKAGSCAAAWYREPRSPGRSGRPGARRSPSPGSAATRPAGPSAHRPVLTAAGSAARNRSRGRCGSASAGPGRPCAAGS